jgi:hypothetical protein
MSSAQLRKRWVDVTRKPVPRISPTMMRLALAWELQARVHGGHSRRALQRLDQLAAAKTVTTMVKPGMRFVREWKGKLHVVNVGDDGVVHWDGREWKSLSEVARSITGTRWSGPAFFGLKQRRTAA